MHTTNKAMLPHAPASFLFSGRSDRGARIARLLASAGVLLAISACSSVNYRCPLDPTEAPEEATACVGMNDAMAGSRKGTGGNLSVVMDNQGRLVPHELLYGKVARPVLGQGASHQGPYQEPTGSPVFVQPRTFQAYTESFQDANGNLHDGHHAYFVTPGHWSRGAMDRPTEIGANLMGPTRPGEQPPGRIVTTDARTGSVIATPTPQAPPAPLTEQQRSQAAKAGAKATAGMLGPQANDKAAMKNLSDAAKNAAQQAARPGARGLAPRVTAPSVQLGS